MKKYLTVLFIAATWVLLGLGWWARSEALEKLEETQALLESLNPTIHFKRGFELGFEMGVNSESRYYSFEEFGRDSVQNAYKRALSIYPEYRED